MTRLPGTLFPHDLAGCIPRRRREASPQGPPLNFDFRTAARLDPLPFAHPPILPRIGPGLHFSGIGPPPMFRTRGVFSYARATNCVHVRVAQSSPGVLSHVIEGLRRRLASQSSHAYGFARNSHGFTRGNAFMSNRHAPVTGSCHCETLPKYFRRTSHCCGPLAWKPARGGVLTPRRLLSHGS